MVGRPAREKLLSGVKKLDDIVGLTLGPRGRNVVLDRGGVPLITNDGVTIAREVELDDLCESLGAKIMLQASSQTNTRAGDGTTSSIVLGREILERGFGAIEEGESAIMLKDELSELSHRACAIVDELAVPLDNSRIEAIATSSSASPEVGALVTQGFDLVGLDGVVTLEENNLGKNTLLHVEGCEVPASLATPYLIEDSQTLETHYENAKICIVDGVIKNVNDLRPLLELAHAQKLNLVLIADDFSAEVLQAILANRVRGGLRVLALKLSEFPDRRGATLEDLVALTGASLVCAEFDLNLSRVKSEHLGTCESLRAGLESTKLIVKAKENEALSKRVEIIRAQINSAVDEFSRSVLKKRLAKLTSGIAIISIGGATDVEIKEKKLRAEDAISAVRSASEDGIVAGGGIAYLRVAERLGENDGRAGEILVKSLESITRRILHNADEDADGILKKIQHSSEQDLGFNAKERVFCNMLEANIIDPAKVVKEVIKNALSAAATLLTTEGAIVNKST